MDEDVGKVESGIDFFSDDGAAPVLPSINKLEETGGLNLISEGIDKAIRGDVVKSLMIPENFELALPNYVLDFRQAKTLRKHQIETLATLVREDGDTNLYVCLSNGLEKLGMGVGVILNNVLQTGIESVFNGVCRLYRNVEQGKPLQELRTLDPKTIRLEL